MTTNVTPVSPFQNLRVDRYFNELLQSIMVECTFYVLIGVDVICYRTSINTLDQLKEV